MATKILLSENKNYIQVIQTGALNPEEIKQARFESKPLFKECDSVLVDYREADLSGMSLITLDTLSMELKQDVPKCVRMAILRTAGRDEKRYNHLVNVCNINGIETQLFEKVEPAVNWLICKTNRRP